MAEAAEVTVLGSALSWEDVTTFAVLMATVAAPLTWVWRDSRAGIRSVDERVDRLEAAQATQSLHVAQTYVTAEAFVRTEERLLAAIDRLGDKFDTGLTLFAKGAIADDKARSRRVSDHKGD